MFVERLRGRLRSAGRRRADLSVAAYCHAFGVPPEAPPDARADGGSEDEDR